MDLKENSSFSFNQREEEAGGKDGGGRRGDKKMIKGALDSRKLVVNTNKFAEGLKNALSFMRVLCKC